MKRQIDITRLTNAMLMSRRSLERFRANRREMVRQFVGRHWSEEGTRERVPVNLIARFIQVVSRNLVPQAPRLLLTTFTREAKPTLSALQTWANKEIERMHLADTLQRVVIDALFSVGICKVALATPADSAGASWNLGAGQPFAGRVDLDDFVYDVHATDFSHCSYIGHRYRAPREAAIAWLGKKAKDLQASKDRQYNEQGDERISMLGRGYQAGDSEEFEAMVDLWEVYLPRHRLVLTLPDDYLSGVSAWDQKELLRQPWVGPEDGPYHILGMMPVPGNAMPKAPVQDLLDLHEASNRSIRKVMRMVDRVKEVAAVAGAAMEDGSRIVDANDGEMIRVDRPDATRQIVFGGSALQPVVAGATLFQDLFNSQAGNLELLGGQGPQSKTATQDKILNENATAGLADMQQRTIGFVSQVGKGLTWYWWHDPFSVQKAPYRAGPAEVMREVYPAGHQDLSRMRRAGRFEDLGIKVDPYSLQFQTPEGRLAKLNQVVQNILIPLSPLLEKQGIMMDFNKYLKIVSEYMDLPELPEIATIREPPTQESPASQPEEPGMPGQTERSYTRHNVSEATQQGQNRNLIQNMLGAATGGNGQANGLGG